MTEARRRRPSFAWVLWGSIALFAVLFALLAYRLGSGEATASARPVVVRKVIQRRIVTTVVPSPGAAAAGGGSATTSSAPVVSSPAVAPIATGAS